MQLANSIATPLAAIKNEHLTVYGWAMSSHEAIYVAIGDSSELIAAYVVKERDLGIKNTCKI